MMKRRGWMWGLGAACALASSALCAAEPTEAQVRQLMQVFGVDRMLEQMNSQMAGMMRQQLPCVPASYWQNFIDAQGKAELLKQMVPVYQRHFSAADVEGLLKFYHSPLGQKVIKEMPATMTEGMQIGQQWGRKRGEAMMAKLQQEGKVTGAGRCPAEGAAESDAAKLGAKPSGGGK